MSKKHECGSGTHLEGSLWHVLVALGSFCLFAWSHHSAFLDPYVINDDVRQQLFWMQRWVNPDLYPSDLLNEYARLYVPWGVQAIYYCASFFFDPLFFSKILTGVVYIGMASLVYLTARAVGGGLLGVAVVSVFWMMPFFLHAISGGLARAFAGPLLMLFIYGNVRTSRVIIAISLLLQALFIPYIFVLSCVACGIAWGLWRVGLAPKPPFLVRLGDLLLLGVAGGVMFSWHMQMKLADFGPLPSYAEMVGRPEYSDTGRFHILPVPSIFHELFVRPWEFIAPFRDKGDIIGTIGLVIILVLLGVGLRSVNWSLIKKQLPLVTSLALASIGLYCAARILLFQLFLPSRYLEYSVNIGYCFLLGLFLFGLFCSKYGKYRQTVYVCMLMALVIGGWRAAATGIYDYSDDAALCRFIEEKTPEDAVIAGFPSQMDNVLTFGRRNVFVAYELAHPWNIGFWSQFEPRLRQFFDVYYSDQLEDVIAYCMRNNIAYVVVDDRFYSKDFMMSAPFFSPFDAQIRNIAKPGKSYALLSEVIPSERIDSHIRIIDVSRLGRFVKSKDHSIR